MTPRSNMRAALHVLEGCIADLETFPTNEGISYLVANRIRRLRDELANFGPRDLLTTAEADRP